MSRLQGGDKQQAVYPGRCTPPLVMEMMIPVVYYSRRQTPKGDGIGHWFRGQRGRPDQTGRVFLPLATSSLVAMCFATSCSSFIP